MRAGATTSARQNLQGNHACALGAIAAGCRFYAGYPITPSSEVAERMALELPRVDGMFIQMEDEIASMGAVLGASMGGVKAMTASSGPGFSLKQENLGYAAGAEIPCVVVDVMRGGPSTGMPTRPSQGDVDARIALGAASQPVAEQLHHHLLACRIDQTQDVIEVPEQGVGDVTLRAERGPDDRRPRRRSS